MHLARATEQFDPFAAVPLDAAMARQAYPLVRISNPAISMSDWLAFARRVMRLAPDRGGILALSDRRDCIHAIFTYRVDHSITLGRFLRISDIMIGHLPGLRPEDAILKSARHLAAKLDCPSMVLESLTSEEEAIGASPVSAPFGYLHRKKVLRAVKHH